MISILTVTYNRPEWWDWLFHQVDKQTDDDWEHIVVDGGRDPLLFERCAARPNTVYVPCIASIPVQRSAAIHRVSPKSTHLVWFDDDDWQSPTRLERSYDPLCQGVTPPIVVANRWAPVVDIRRPKLCERQGYEPFVFNSMCLPSREFLPGFNPSLHTDEDIDWIRRLEPSEYLIQNEPLFAWISHDRNVTNARKGRLFESRCTIPFDDWELEMLKRIAGG